MGQRCGLTSLKLFWNETKVHKLRQTDHGVAAEDLELDPTTRKTPIGQFCGNPQVGHDVVFEHFVAGVTFSRPLIVPLPTGPAHNDSNVDPHQV